MVAAFDGGVITSKADALLVDLFLDAHERALRQIVLDLDAALIS